MYNQHTRGMAMARHKCLVERGGRATFIRDKGLAHTNKKKQKKEGGKREWKKNDIHKSNKKDSSK